MDFLSFEIFIILLLILLNGFLSMSEMALVSSKKARLTELAQKGNRGARLALSLLENSNAFLASIQVGITLIGVFAGAFSGATISEEIGAYLKEYFPKSSPYAEAVGVGAVVVIVTYFSLVLGELVPKRLALMNPEVMASRVARLIELISKFSAPMIWILTLSSNFIMRFLGLEKHVSAPVTEEEVKILIEQGTQAGVFEKVEESMLKRVLQFADLKAKDLMTPRPQVLDIDLDDTSQLNIEKVKKIRHSYIPVHRGGLDHFVGLLSKKMMLDNLLKRGISDINLGECVVSDVLFVPESLQADKLLEKFKKTKKHIGMVVDEFGGIAGIVSIIDLLECIVGFLSEDQRDTEPFFQREDGSWLIDANVYLNEVTDLEGLQAFQNIDSEGSDTLAAFILEQMGKIPSTGDQFHWSDLTIEIVDMDGRRIDKVLIRKSEE